MSTTDPIDRAAEAMHAGVPGSRLWADAQQGYFRRQARAVFASIDVPERQSECVAQCLQPGQVGITGLQAAERAADLVAENAALRATVARVRRLADVWDRTGERHFYRLAIRAALDGDS